MTLYELSLEANNLLGVLTTPQTDEDGNEMADEEIQLIIRDTLDGLGLSEKLDSYGKLIRQLTADAAAVKAEKQRLASLQSYIENNIQRMKDNLLNFMDASESSNCSTDIFRFSVRESKAVNITDMSLIPEEFLKVETSVNKTELKKALAKEEVPGAEIITNRSVTIK